IMTVSGSSGRTTIDDWVVSEVKRPKNAGCEEFIASFTSNTGKTYNYQAGDIVTIRVILVIDTPDAFIEFSFTAIEGRWKLRDPFDFRPIDFERVMK
ncbi:MAG: hypothetical protein IJS09_01685, partial [Treponema sp.]|nr:hypothetical protein [Treponema sp.]